MGGHLVNDLTPDLKIIVGRTAESMKKERKSHSVVKDPQKHRTNQEKKKSGHLEVMTNTYKLI